MVAAVSTDLEVDVCKGEAEGRPEKPPRVLIVSDVRLHREGMAALLGDQFEIVGIVAKAEFASGVAHLLADVVLIDVACLNSGGQVTAPGTAPTGKMIAFGVSNAESEILACAQAGISGFIDKDGSANDVVATIAGVARGERPSTPRFVGTLSQWLTAIVQAQAHEPVAPALSGREFEVSRYLVQGRSNKEIARQLGISAATVKNHVHNILEKLHVHTRAEAVAAMTQFRRLLTIIPCWQLAVEMLFRG
jgi:two-component system nitrate/nitrite response regulator NarL